jgi:hypothetical protein
MIYLCFFRVSETPESNLLFSVFSYSSAGGRRNNNRWTRDGSRQIGHLLHVIDCYCPPILVRRGEVTLG